MTDQQVKKIRAYLEKQGIEYLDLQAELIDYFACEVERYQKEDPNLSFKVALHKAHRSFGGEQAFCDLCWKRKRGLLVR